MMYLLVAHPGHELLLHGWISRNKPAVHVLTDGAAHSSGRLASTAEFLRDAGARTGSIFGRLSDAEAYEMLLERNVALVYSIVSELANELQNEQPSIIVSDSAEGYNPVHDLCRLIAGAAIAMAGVRTKQYEFAVVNHPQSFDAAEIVVELDDAEYAAKMERSRRQAGALIDIDDLLKKHGADAYRLEALRAVADWRAIDEGETPLYERFGEERVAAHRYTNVIRRREHMLPLRDALCAEVEKRSCVF